jgi:hypothetical protein
LRIALRDMIDLTHQGLGYIIDIGKFAAHLALVEPV